MPSYKLIYFDACARGEPARMLFALKGQVFEDVRFQYGDPVWLKVKGDKTSYFGNNNDESSAIDEILGVVVDFEMAMMSAFDETDAPRREANFLKLRDTRLKPFYEFFSESLQKSGGKFYVGNQLTLADLVVFNILDFFIDDVLQIEDYFKAYPVLLKFYQSIKNDSQLTSYLKARKYTPY